MNSSYKSRIARRLCLATIGLATLVLSVAPYAAQALEILQPDPNDKKPENNDAAPETTTPPARDLWSISFEPAAETPQDQRATVEVRMFRYDVANLEAARFHTHARKLPNDADILQHAFEIGIRSAGNYKPSHTSRMLLDGGGPQTLQIAMVRACGRQLALLEVLRHDLTAPGENLVSFDEAVLVAIRRGLEHIRHFGMPILGDGVGVMHVPMPMPYNMG